MDSEELYNRDIAERAKHFEHQLESGESFFYDTDELEEIIDYYLDEEQWSKALRAINYGIHTYPFESYYQIKKAEVLIAKKDTKSAILILEDVLSREPHNGDIARLLGDAYYQNMQFKRAVDFYHLALKEGLDAEELIIKLARIHFLLNKPGKALSYLNSFPKDFFFDDTVLPDLVKLFYDYGYAPKAVEFLERIIDEDPFNYSAWYFLGFTYQKLENYRKAITAFEYAIAIDDENTMGYLGKGNALMELDLFEEAIEFLNQALDNDLTDAEVYCNIAECYENLDNYNSAKYFYLKAIKIDSRLSDAYYGLGVVYKKEGLYRDASKNLLYAIDYDPFESLYHIELAEVYLITQEKEKAIFHYQKAAEIDPETPEIILDLAQALFEFEDIDAAIETLMKHQPDFIDDHRFSYRLASYLFQKGNYQKGYEILHLALQQNSEEYFLLYEYAPFLESNETISNIIDLYLSK
ncbi:tetratricopeptide repeat protein [bacterium]|nr:tetratricopeptide repeat protein [bacterium]